MMCLICLYINKDFNGGTQINLGQNNAIISFYIYSYFKNQYIFKCGALSNPSNDILNEAKKHKQITKNYNLIADIALFNNTTNVNTNNVNKQFTFAHNTNYNGITTLNVNIPTSTTCPSNNYFYFAVRLETTDTQSSNIIAYLESAIHIYTIKYLLSDGNFSILLASENFFQDISPLMEHGLSYIEFVSSDDVNPSTKMLYYFYNNENYLILDHNKINSNQLEGILTDLFGSYKVNNTTDTLSDLLFNLFCTTYVNKSKGNKKFNPIFDKFFDGQGCPKPIQYQAEIKMSNYITNELLNWKLANYIITDENIILFITDLIIFYKSKYQPNDNRFAKLNILKTKLLNGIINVLNNYQNKIIEINNNLTFKANNKTNNPTITNDFIISYDKNYKNNYLYGPTQKLPYNRFYISSKLNDFLFKSTQKCNFCFQNILKLDQNNYNKQMLDIINTLLILENFDI